MHMLMHMLAHMLMHMLMRMLMRTHIRSHAQREHAAAAASPQRQRCSIAAAAVASRLPFALGVKAGGTTCQLLRRATATCQKLQAGSMQQSAS